MSAPVIAVGQTFIQLDEDGHLVINGVYLFDAADVEIVTTKGETRVSFALRHAERKAEASIESTTSMASTPG